MESRKCTKCKKNKNGDEFNGMNKMCIECLDKQKESNKVYNQKEVFCDICQRNVKQCRLSKHVKTDRHSSKEKLKKEEEKNKYIWRNTWKMMKPELQNWNKSGKPLHQKTSKDFNPIFFHIIIYEKLWFEHRNVRRGWFRFMILFYNNILW